MSGLFRRLSSRRSGGPEGEEPQHAAEPGATDAPAQPSAESGGHDSLLTDPAADVTRVIPDPAQPPTEAIRASDPAAAQAEPATGYVPPAQPIAEPAAGHVPPAAGYVPPIQPPVDPAAGYVPPAVGYVPPSQAGTWHSPPAGAIPNQPAPFVAPPVYPAPVGYSPGPPEQFPVGDLPAGLDPDELATAPPTSARRSRLRRRVAFLRAAREVLLRDLGGFVYELHRTAHDIEADAHRRLRDIKLTRLTRVDAELHDLEMLLDDVRRQVIVREPGVGGECPQCGELFGSAAHFCWQCGLPLTESARRELARAQAAAVAPEPLPDPVIHPTPVEQPTQEFSPLDPDHPEAGGNVDFQWPTRTEGDEDPTRTISTTEAAPDEAPATSRRAGDGGRRPRPRQASPRRATRPRQR